MGAVVYSGLQAEHNATAAPGVKPVGIMIVTRLKAQAEEVVSDINAYVGRHVAVADHTDSRATPEQFHEIIDEALANVVEHTQLKLDELSRVTGRIAHEMRLSHAVEVDALETLRECMLFQAGANDGFGVGTSLAWEAAGSLEDIAALSIMSCRALAGAPRASS